MDTVTIVTHLWSPKTIIKTPSLASPVDGSPPTPTLQTILPSPNPHNRRDRDDEEEFSRLPIPTIDDDEDFYDELFYDTDPETDPHTFNNNVTTLDLTLETSNTLLDEVATVDMAFRIGPGIDGRIQDQHPPHIPIHHNQYTVLPQVYDKVRNNPPSTPQTPRHPQPSVHVKRKRRFSTRSKSPPLLPRPDTPISPDKLVLLTSHGEPPVASSHAPTTGGDKPVALTLSGGDDVKRVTG
jgi:hypothetical protein